MKFSKRRKRYLKQRISVLRGRGLSYKQIALKLGISERTVYRLRQPNDKAVVLYPLGNARASAASRSVAIRLRVRAFLQVRLVAYALGVNTSTVYRWQQKYTTKSNAECRE